MVEPDLLDDTRPLVSADKWLHDRNSELLRQIITWVGRLLLFSIGLTVVMGMRTPHLWQVWVILLAQVLGLGVQQLALARLDQGKLRAASLMVIMLQVCTTVLAALFFRNMVIDYAVMALMHIIMANVLISPRASAVLAGGLVALGVGLVMVQLSGLSTLQIVIPWTSELLVHAFLFFVSLFIGTLLVTRNTDNARRALALSAEQAHKVAVANRQLAQEMADRQRAEQDRLRLAVEHERVRILSSFIRDASHEFRNPLAIINTHLYMLQKRQPELEDSESVRVIQEQSTYIAALVDALLEMSKLDSTASFARAPVDINDLLRDLAGSFDGQARRRGLRLQVDLAPDLPPVQGDVERLRQALFHIIRNAIEHSEGGGIVALASQRSSVGIVLVIQDEGEGIDPEDLPHIFERFFQGDRTRTARGVGLGLPIARKIIDAHGGQIGVTSVVGQGTTFRIVLPAG